MIILCNIAATVFLAITLVATSSKLIFNPISELADAALRLSRGDLSSRLTTRAVGEMQQLFDSFNQMAENLQQTTVSKEYVNNIIRSMTESLFIISPDYTVRDANHAAAALLGYPEHELAGTDARGVFDTELLEKAATAATTEQRLVTESWCMRKDGLRVPVYFTASGMRDMHGALQGIVCTAVDISPMKEASEQLAAMNRALHQEIEHRRQAQEEAVRLNVHLQSQKSALEAANKELESFCYSVSHDLRAPLRHINGFTSVLREDYAEALNDEGRDCLDRICAASTRMGMLIDDLLRFSRVSRTNMNVADIDLTERAHKIATMFRELDPDRTTRIEIEEGLTARGDATMLDMVLQNLIGNAWKYSAGKPDGIISLGSMHLHDRTVYFVRDNGIGFDMAYREKLFKVFERLHGDEIEGTGIGLATVQRIIERHGGSIWAEGEVGKGATFYFTLAGTATEA